MQASAVAGGARAQTRWLMRLRRHGGPAMVLAIALPLASGILLVGQAWLLADVLHRAIVQGEPRGALVGDLGLIVALIAARLLLGLAAETAGVAAAERIKLRLRRALAARLLAARPDGAAERSSGAAAAALVDHVDGLDGFFARFMPAMIQAAILPLALAAAVLPVDLVVGLLFLVTAPLIPLFMALVGMGAEAASRSHAQALSRLSAGFADRLRGLVTLKLFGRAEIETRRVAEASEELRRRAFRVLRIAFLSSAVLEFFATIGVAGVALYVGLTFLGVIEWRGDALTLRAALFCLLMAPEIYQPLRVLAAHYHDRAAAKAAVGEIASRLGELPEPVAAPARPALPVPAGPACPATRIEVRGLTIACAGRSRPILDGACLTLEPGRRVALLGESGIGKSTLLDALARLRDADGGEILLDGRPIASLDEATFRRTVAFLGQRPRIFHGTIASNIRLGRPDADRDAIARAAELALVDEFARGLPAGLDTPIGEDGLGLSGGEAHRVALARLYLRDPGLLLLDEPTAHLDAATASRLLDRLVGFAAGRTLVVSTHAAQVAERMDETVRIVAGRVVPGPVPFRLEQAA